jgi:hypothetical protein
MGICKYCGQTAGLFRKKHIECEKKYNHGWQQMVQLVYDAVLGNTVNHELEKKLNEIAEASYIKPYQIKETILAGWEKTVEHLLDDGNLDEDEEKRLISFISHFQLSQDALDRNGAYSKIVKGAILRDLMNGKIPEKRVKIEGDSKLHFNFQKSEKLIWWFTNVAYYEDKTRRQYIGGYQGVGFRIAKGVYYRIGGFRGYPVETTERVYVDTGHLAVTNKHIYFGGDTKSFRIRLDKIVSFIPYEDGISIQRDAARAKPQTFITGDGWFTYNLLLNVGNV